MNRLTLALLWAVLFVGCAEPVPAYELFTDYGSFPEFVVCDPGLLTSEEEKASEIIWDVTFDCEEPDAVVEVHDLGDKYAGFWILDGGWLFGGEVVGRILLNSRLWSLSNGEPDLVLAHEIGHGVGYDHSENWCSVMKTGDWNVPCIRASISAIAAEKAGDPQ